MVHKDTRIEKIFEKGLMESHKLTESELYKIMTEDSIKNGVRYMFKWESFR